MQTCQGSFRLHLVFICMESMAGMCATMHYIIEADELFVLFCHMWQGVTSSISPQVSLGLNLVGV